VRWDDCTVVIPTWNHGRYLGDCLESVLSQTLPPGDVIVVDDGSTDDTRAVLGRFNGRVRVILMPSRQGAAFALRVGVERATTDWIQPMGADDLVPAHYLRRHRDAVLAHRNTGAPLGLVYSRAQYLVGEATRGEFGGGAWDPQALMRGNYIHGAPVIAMAAWQDAGGVRAEPHEDWELWKRIAARGWAGAYVEDTWLLYRQHGLGHRNYGTDDARDQPWAGQRVDVAVRNPVFPDAEAAA
jgi:hypothetical protein